jgi:chorismate synthase
MLCGILEGLPAGVKISLELINQELSRRQQGPGRGERMKIEKDKVRIVSGLRFGQTLGSPLTLLIENKDWVNWKEVMAIEGPPVGPAMTCPRPGHGDLAGWFKYQPPDLRNVLERASARETAVRVALGAVAKQFLALFRISIISHLIALGPVKLKSKITDWTKIKELAEKSPLRCIEPETTERMKKAILRAQKKGDTLGGGFEVAALNVPPGLGSYVQWDRRLDGCLARAVMSIPGIKAVEIGGGKEICSLFGSAVHDEIFYQPKEKKFYRTTNQAGGIEAGVSNGQPVVIKGWMKPIPTLKKPLRSVNLATKKPHLASFERSDICAVPAASIVAEAMVALEITRFFLEKFGGDSLKEVKRNFRHYLKTLEKS